MLREKEKIVVSETIVFRYGLLLIRPLDHNKGQFSLNFISIFHYKRNEQILVSTATGEG